MVLYRPFLHHALKNMRSNNHISLKAYACGSACIKAAMQVVWLAETLESNLFNEAHWFSTFIISFTAACLVLFVMSNEGDPTLKETEDAVRRIKTLCRRHSAENPSFLRCYRFLEVSLHALLNGDRKLTNGRAFNPPSQPPSSRVEIRSMPGASKFPVRSAKPIDYRRTQDWRRSICKVKTCFKH